MRRSTLLRVGQLAVATATASCLLSAPAQATSIGGFSVRPAHFDANKPATRAYFVKTARPGHTFTDQVVGNVGKFIGVKNFEYLAGNATFWSAIWNTITIVPAVRMARMMASWKFSPGPMSRLDIQQLMPRFSSAPQIVSASWNCRNRMPGSLASKSYAENSR